MVIGSPRESQPHEHRVGLTPFLANRLVELGHTVLIEAGAGVAAHFSDGDYQRAGAQIVYSAEEVYRRSDIVCRVGAVAESEIPLLRPGLTICSFHHLAVAPKERVRALMELGATLVGYEIIRDAAGCLPALRPMSEMAGQLAIHVAAHHLQTERGGRGILIGHVPGVPPPTVLVLGAGTVGHAAARQATACGCHVIVVDHDLQKLARIHADSEGRVVTAIAGLERLERYTSVADVVVGAILIPGDRAPFVVTEKMVEGMKAGSVILDVSIDQGGCVETSRPTTLADPTYIYQGVVHYAVPNMTASIARSASRALATATHAYLVRLAELGLEKALAADPGLAQGIYMANGKMVNATAGSALGIPVVGLAEALEKGNRG